MLDVLLSSIELDDLSPFYMGHLFAMMMKPITGANVAALEMDITRRQDFGENFEAIYLNRNVVCAGCHNSEWGTTDNPDPEKDLHHPTPGLVEKALYGASTGRPEMEVYSAFRRLGIVTDNGTRPWGINSACGELVNQQNVSDDPADYTTYFGSDLGKTASIWDVEALLRDGFDSLRSSGMLAINPDTGEVPADEAFAYMVSMRIVNQVWREVMGYGLTLVHYFPRNTAQKDLLLQLTNHFVMEQWSLRTLLLDVVTHPLYNDTAPMAGCGEAGHAYIL